MRGSRIDSTITVLILLTLAVGGAYAADVPLPEASEQSGNGSNRVGHTLWYTGVCAPRVGVSIGYLDRRADELVAAELQRYAQRSIKHVVARCPEVVTVEVNARSMTTLLSPFYRFLMHRDENWAIRDFARSDQIVQSLLETGYLPAKGPDPLMSNAYVRFENGRLDVVYGLNLNGRMAAAYAEKRVARISDEVAYPRYVLRGDWYESSSSDNADACDSSRDGYPFWGSFVMQVNPSQANIMITRKACADHDEKGAITKPYLRNLRRSSQRELGLEAVVISETIAAALEADSILIDGLDAAEFAKVRQPLVDKPEYRLYSSKPDVCTHLEFDVVYRANHERRDDVFGGDYQKRVGLLVRGQTQKLCGSTGGASVAAFRVGEDQYWDKMSFTFQTPARGAIGAGRNVLRTHVKSGRARAHDQWLQDRLLGPVCGEVFCDLPGGRYLNAIYNGRIDDVRQMDFLFEQSQRALVAQQNDEGILQAIALGPVRAALRAGNSQLLRRTANKYMHSYAAWGEECFDSGATEKTFEYTTPTVIETDQYGTTTTGGITFSAKYTVNPEFFVLRDQLGDSDGAQRSDSPALLPEQALVFRGVVEMKNSYQCRSAEVKQFEAQLRALTAAVIDSPGTQKASSRNLPPVPKLALSGPFPQLNTKPETSAQVPRVLPVSLTSSGSKRPSGTPEKLSAASSPAPTDAVVPVLVPVPESAAGLTILSAEEIAGMTTQQRAQRMQLELRQLEEVMQKRTTDLGHAFSQAMQNGAAPAEQQRLMQEYEQEVVKLQSEILQQAQKVRAAYQ